MKLEIKRFTPAPNIDQKKLDIFLHLKHFWELKYWQCQTSNQTKSNPRIKSGIIKENIHFPYNIRKTCWQAFYYLTISQYIECFNNILGGRKFSQALAFYFDLFWKRSTGITIEGIFLIVMFAWLRPTHLHYSNFETLLKYNLFSGKLKLRPSTDLPTPRLSRALYSSFSFPTLLRCYLSNKYSMNNYPKEFFIH